MTIFLRRIYPGPFVTKMNSRTNSSVSKCHTGNISTRLKSLVTKLETRLNCLVLNATQAIEIASQEISQPDVTPRF